MLTLEDIPIDDEDAYNLYCSRKILGSFQTESPLLRQWAGKLKPKNIIDVSNIIAAVRPGVLKSYDDDGVSMIEHYRRRVNGEEPPTPIHPSLESILRNSRGVMLFQEELMAITKRITNFNDIETNALLKAVSKKKPEEIAAIKKQFVASSTEKGIVTEIEATKIYESFEASGRYLFNLAHSISYAHTSYFTTWLKTHYKLEFFTSWLTFAEDKDEIAALVRDSKGFGINVVVPDIRNIIYNFYIKDDTTIGWGFTSIVGCGEAQVVKIRNAVESIEKHCNKCISELSWIEFLVYGYNVTNLFDDDADVTIEQISKRKNLSKKLIENLIKTGALDFWRVPRNKLLHETRQFKMLSPGERNWCAAHLNESSDLIGLLELAAFPKRDGGAAHNDNRLRCINSIIKILKDPPIKLSDSLRDLIIYEKELLNCSLTINQLDLYDSLEADCTVAELSTKHQDIYCVKCQITRLKLVANKTGKNIGKNRAYLSIADESGESDEIIAYTDKLLKLSELGIDYEGATALLWLSRDKRSGQFIIQNAKGLI